MAVTREYLESTLSSLSLEIDFVDLCKLYGQIRQYTNITCDLTFLEQFKAFYGDDIVKSIESSNSSRYQRLKRFRKYVSWCLNTDGYCLFVTLTFDDDMLKTSSKYRKDKVTAFLKSCSPYYLANIDFGSKTDREHYHAILYFPYEKEYQCFLSRCKRNKQGAFNCEEWKALNEFIICRSNDDDVTRLSKYINKLSNHAFKDSTKTSRYHAIYSDGITILNKILKVANTKAVWATNVRGGLRSKLHLTPYVPNLVVGYKKVTNRIRDEDCDDLKQIELARLLYRYQWKRFNDTFKPCNRDDEYIDVDGNLISLVDLPF